MDERNAHRGAAPGAPRRRYAPPAAGARAVAAGRGWRGAAPGAPGTPVVGPVRRPRRGPPPPRTAPPAVGARALVGTPAVGGSGVLTRAGRRPRDGTHGTAATGRRGTGAAGQRRDVPGRSVPPAGTAATGDGSGTAAATAADPARVRRS